MTDKTSVCVIGYRLIIYWKQPSICLNHEGPQRSMCMELIQLADQTVLICSTTDNIKPRGKISNAKAGIKDQGEICPPVSISPSLDEHIR